ncbi:MAG: DUF2200 domain-containing protein [Streptococcaceae bacterium]|jgi:hypothetical protein|nr:DUF2200 domain-containing protein [Streptococcaceae bacterium]
MTPEQQHDKFARLHFEKIYPMYVEKVTRKGRTVADLDIVLSALTGFETPSAASGNYAELFERAEFAPWADKITGVICGVRVETLEDPLIKKARQIDKVVDELAKGKTIEKIKREV